jgi:hypothetical protein
MPKYIVNDAAFAFAKDLIEHRRYVLRSDWGERHPLAADEYSYL